MRLSIICLLFFISASTYGQFVLHLKVVSKADGTRLPASVIIKETRSGLAVDTTGISILNFQKEGRYALVISSVGYEEKELRITIPFLEDTLEIPLEAQESEEEVIVISTRTSRAIRDIPTRVEIISGEELEEKGNMKPGDIRMLLNESTGIQTQQTSATSYSSSIRIQGLDGKYTQLLRDGFPLYGAFAGSLSIMQITPLDLQQVEVIKGSSSTLYGGGAIAGLVNLVSKTPASKPELSFMVNGTSAIGYDISGFYSQKFNKVGLTVFSAHNNASPYDPAGIGFTAIPKFERYTINPRAFFYGSKIAANFGVSYITEDRIGGSINYIRNNGTGYYELNNTDRFSTQGAIKQNISEHSSLNFKNSYSRFKRRILIPSYTFNGVQQSTFSELTYNTQGDKAQWIAGINFITDGFAEEAISSGRLRNYYYNTSGIFIQNTWSPINDLTIESGLRGDYVKEYGLELLPRISILLKLLPDLTVRVGGGFGYKTPTIFNEEAERMQFQNVLPININSSVNERSLGSSFDFNYRASVGELSITVNQLLFYTRLNQPLVLSATNAGDGEFVNAQGYIDTKGIETNVKIIYHRLKLFIGYTYADVNSHFNNIKSWYPLTARNRLNNVLMYEQEGKLKIGLEAYYFGNQKLNDGSMGTSYWTAGVMAEKIWKGFSAFLNFENFTDTRQTRFGSIYTGSVANPIFKDIYAPLDGFVLNGGIKVRL